MKPFCATCAVAGLLLVLGGVAEAELVTFSDLDPGGDLGQQAELAADYSTGLPAGITATWTGWMWKNAAGPDDHTPDNDDHMQIFVSGDAASISFSAPLIVPELWMYRTGWGATGDWTVKGLLGGEEKWSHTIATSDAWISVQDGAGIAVDELSLPEQGQWNHVDDITFAAVPEPGTLVLLGLAGLCLAALRWRKR